MTIPNVTNVTKNGEKIERESTRKKKTLFIENFLPKAGNISAICKAIKISRQQYYRWLERDEEFKQAIEDEGEALIDWVESKAYVLIDEKNTAMIKFFLKTKGRYRGYSETGKTGTHKC